MSPPLLWATIPTPRRSSSARIALRERRHLGDGPKVAAEVGNDVHGMPEPVEVPARPPRESARSRRRREAAGSAAASQREARPDRNGGPVGSAEADTPSRSRPRACRWCARNRFTAGPLGSRDASRSPCHQSTKRPGSARRENGHDVQRFRRPARGAELGPEPPLRGDRGAVPGDRGRGARTHPARRSGRALGSRHSFTDLPDTKGRLISLERFAPDIVIDPEAQTVSFSPGLALRAISRAS